MKYCFYFVLLLLIGCSTHKPVSFLDYVCPTYQEFRDMQDSSDTSNCRRIIKEGEVINGQKIVVTAPDPDRGGILPVIVQERDGKETEGFMFFLRVEF